MTSWQKKRYAAVGRPLLSPVLVLIAVLSSDFVGSPAKADERCEAAAYAERIAPRVRIIAHRGASGDRPEHTLGAYALGIAQGADFIEPDLVTTSDGVLIARHEPMLAIVELDDDGRIVIDDGRAVVIEATTDVADRAEFADRLTVKAVGDHQVAGWFSEDFTAAEIATLWARERLPAIRPANAGFNDRYRVPTLAQIIELVRRIEARTGRSVGIYPELKAGRYFLEHGRRLSGEPIAIDVAKQLADTLTDGGFTDPARVIVQSFEPTVLLDLRRRVLPAADLALPLVQLIGQPTAVPRDLRESPPDELVALTRGDLLSGPALTAIASYASGIGPPFVAVDSGVVRRAHCVGLEVHPYTFRAEPGFLPTIKDRRLSFAQLVRHYRALGIDGLFTDNVADAVRVLR